MDELGLTGKNVYIIYSHRTNGEWGLILAGLACDDTNALDESIGINAFVKEHPGIKGLIIRNLDFVVIVIISIKLLNFNSVFKY